MGKVSACHCGIFDYVAIHELSFHSKKSASHIQNKVCAKVQSGFVLFRVGQSPSRVHSG